MRHHLQRRLSQLSPDLKVMPARPRPCSAKFHRPQPRWGNDPEMELLVYGNRLKRKRSELFSDFKLEGYSDERIIRIAQREMAADERLREAKEAVHQRLRKPEPDLRRQRRKPCRPGTPAGRAKAGRRRRVAARLIPLPDQTSRTEEQAREIAGRKKSAPVRGALTSRPHPRVQMRSDL